MWSLADWIASVPVWAWVLITWAASLFPAAWVAGRWYRGRKVLEATAFLAVAGWPFTSVISSLMLLFRSGQVAPEPKPKDGSLPMPEDVSPWLSETRCPECDEAIDGRDNPCPHCGHNRRHNWAGLKEIVYRVVGRIEYKSDEDSA